MRLTIFYEELTSLLIRRQLTVQNIDKFCKIYALCLYTYFLEIIRDKITWLINELKLSDLFPILIFELFRHHDN